MVNAHPRLAIALGDSAGIGSEVVLKALADPAILRACQPTLIGSRTLLIQTYQQMAKPGSNLADPEQLSIMDISDRHLEQQVRLGIGNAASGAISFRALEQAIAQTLAGEFDAIVTAPISKAAWNMAGHHYPGQTELLAERAGATRFGMLFVARSPHTGWTLRTLLATTHIPLRQVPDALTPSLLTTKLDLLVDCMRRDFGIAAPRIAVSGLNPHSGEQGQLGHEEQDWMVDWIQEMGDRLPHVSLEGPVPPDTLWVAPGLAWYGSNSSTASPQAHDAYLALYHDQGLIPVKLMAFDRAVNTTIGLPFIRTSPDHGTAFGIAGQGIADASSMNAAIDLAIAQASQRIEQAAIAG
ncbi:4-hydroxythreonine-4-phosphate dehydrogenase PdxA [Oculatella sp. LEGE 06141]|uniref:4-hydroxythreonine-4-phosphate dehydrogenase PdxA n=1 Tax=Oculatella sp. LEGE 06141 TaxID=1828648 RepID=UPI0018810166|nr:4-hydroxythreonine-4-phosphate dehydrogenase PdxA [Oculatella sp. LEGE 06141]MBE9179787.1 4-hydroxythreonine-4-phosphate dehydrogenase PdxA [Oculatella sp. LEGE 06141]